MTDLLFVVSSLKYWINSRCLTVNPTGLDTTSGGKTYLRASELNTVDSKVEETETRRWRPQRM